MHKREGVPLEQARQRVWLKDSRGLIVKERPAGGLSSHKMPFAHPHEPMEDLADIVRKLKPTVLIGAAAIPNVFAPGSPFPAFKGFGKTYEPGQGNNAYIFP